ncbi:metalloregulator ArsR/SmtB family transcription factor [bacterium]|nr:metalloregulator ArsR/SmtB family transcription factor [bacterium]
MEAALNDPGKIARVFKILSVDTRIKILELVKDRALCVNAIASRLGITAAAASQHLRIMRDADIVVADKDGYFVHYSINRETMAAWKNLADTLLVPEEK